LTIANRNCVVETRGGEQREANDRSARKKLDSVWQFGEPSAPRRSPDLMDADWKRSYRKPVTLNERGKAMAGDC